MQIADRRVASFHYTLTDDDGQVIDSSSGRDPLAYLHGASNIVPGLEQELDGKAAGDKLQVDVSPETGYGEHNPEMMQELPRESFQGVDKIEPGMQFQGNGPQGPVNVRVTAVEGDKVTIDANHPLAGKTLHFDVEIADVREATEAELEQGHVAMEPAQ